MRGGWQPHQSAKSYGHIINEGWAAAVVDYNTQPSLHTTSFEPAHDIIMKMCCGDDKYSITNELKPSKRVDPCLHTIVGGAHINSLSLGAIAIDIIFTSSSPW